MSAMRIVAELQKRDDRGAAGDEHRPEVRNRVEHAGEQAPDRRLLDAERAKREPGRDRDERCW